MADPNYKLANTVSVVVGAETLYLQQTNIREQGEVIDCTNNVNKVYECEIGIVEYSADFTCLVPVASVPTFKTQNVTLAATTGYSGGPQLSGNIKVSTRSITGGARGAANVSGTLLFTGTVTAT
jgi:hypothetical protein